MLWINHISDIYLGVSDFRDSHVSDIYIIDSHVTDNYGSDSHFSDIHLGGFDCGTLHKMGGACKED